MSERVDGVHIRSESERATELLGLLLGEILTEPCVLALEGTLGMGKTAFTRGLVEGLAPGEGEFVSSPTYAVCNVYPTTPPVYHYDLYRLQSEDDLESVGFYDSVNQGVLIIEWPQKVPSVQRYADVHVALHAQKTGQRDIHVCAQSTLGARFVEQWAHALREEADPELQIVA